MTQTSFGKNTVAREIRARQNINIAHATVTRRVYALCSLFKSCPIFSANCSTSGVSDKDRANIKQIPVFIKTGYSFRNMSLSDIISPNPSTSTHINIQTFLLRINEIPATVNSNNANRRSATPFFNAANTINGYRIDSAIPRILMIFINDFFNGVNHVL